MTKEIVITPHAPGAHYSQAIKTEQFIFVSGIGGYQNPDTKEPIEGIEGQTRQCLELIKETIEAAGASLNDVVSVTVYLRNPEDFRLMNRVYKTYFPTDPPARATIVTGLVVPGMLLEVQCIASTPREIY